jgi:hypothetical protein
MTICVVPSWRARAREGRCMVATYDGKGGRYRGCGGVGVDGR